MKSTVETVSPTRVKLAIEVPFEELKPSLDAAYKQIGAQVRIPGFRPGKVPARIIDQRVGRASVIEQAVNDMLPRVYSEAIQEHDVRPFGQPEVDVADLGDLQPGSTLNVTAEVDVRPEVTVPDDLSGIPVTVDSVEVGDADVDEQLDALRARFGTLAGVERPVEEGDFVSLDLATKVDGEDVEDGTAAGLSYEVGKDDLLEGLDAAITGKSAGESATFTTTLKYGEHADSEAEVSATVNSVKVRELPEADDEFAQLASEFDTIGELRDDLRERLSRARALQQGSQARDRLLEKLIETIQFPVPEGAVKAEVDSREHDVIHSLNHDDALFERYLAMQGTTRAEFQKELASSAEQTVRVQLILDAIADKQDVQVGDAELTEYLVRQANRYDMSPTEFADNVVQSGNLPALIADVRRNKALATVLEAAQISDSNGKAVDLNALSLAGVEEIVDDAVAEIAAEDDDTDD